MRALFSRVSSARLAVPVLLALFLPVLLAAQADSIPPGNTNDPHVAFALGLAGLAAFIAQAIGSKLIAVWNKVGGAIEGFSNGSKRALAVALTGALGLAVNYIAGMLTHSTSWLATFGLSLVAGVISTFTAGLAIDNAKAKAAASSSFRSSTGKV